MTEHLNKSKSLSEAGTMIYNAISGDWKKYGLDGINFDENSVLNLALKIDDTIYNNSNDGWPLTPNMDIIHYIKINDYALNKSDRDELFLKMFA